MRPRPPASSASSWVADLSAGGITVRPLVTAVLGATPHSSQLSSRHGGKSHAGDRQQVGLSGGAAAAILGHFHRGAILNFRLKVPGLWIGTRGVGRRSAEQQHFSLYKLAARTITADGSWRVFGDTRCRACPRPDDWSPTRSDQHDTGSAKPFQSRATANS